MKVRELMVRIGVATDGKKLDQFESKLDDVKSAVGDLAGWLTKLATGYAAVTGAAGMVAMKTAEWSEEVVRNADALGMSTDKYQELHFAFNNLGASTDDMMDAFSTLTDRALDAAEGSQTYIDEFERLGIAVEDLEGKRPDQIFDMYTAAAQNAEDRTAAVASAVRLFGDDLGRRIMPALTTAAEDFNHWQEVAQKTGIVMDEAFVRKARQVRFEWRALTGRFKAVFYTLGEQLMPLFESFVERLNLLIDGFLESGEATETFAKFAALLGEDLEKMWDVAGKLAGALGFAFDDVEDPAENLYNTIKIIIGLITGALVTTTLTSIAALVATVGTATLILGAKIAAVVAAITLVLLVVEDVVGYFLGWDTVTGDIVDKFGEGNTVLDSISRFVQEIAKTWEIIKPAVYAVGEVLWSIVKPALLTVWGALKDAVKFVFEIGTGLFQLFNALLLLISGDLDGALRELLKGVFSLLRGLATGLVNAVVRAAQLMINILAPAIEPIMRALKAAGAIDGKIPTAEGMNEAIAAQQQALDKAISKGLSGKNAKFLASVASGSDDAQTSSGAGPMTRSSPAQNKAMRTGLMTPQQMAASRSLSSGGGQSNQTTVNIDTINGSMSKEKEKRAVRDTFSKETRMSYADASGGER